MKKLLIAVFCYFTAVNAANATLLTFDSLANNPIGYVPYVESGYEFWFTDNSSSSHLGDFQSLDGDLAWHSSTTYNIDLTLTKVGGGLFDLNSLFLNNLSDLNAVLVTDKGNYSFSGYGVNNLNILGVSYVTFDMSSDSCCSTGISIDNVTVDATAVPEPSMLALFGLGLAGLGFSRKVKAS